MPGKTGPASPVGVLGRLRRSSTPDEPLLRRARLGDGAAFEELYRRYHSAIFGYCLARLADRHAAEDATQEVFARAASASGVEIGDVRSWLFTVAHNAVVDAVRRRRPDSSLVDLEAVLDSSRFATEESTFAALDTVANVFIALRRLPARERKALILREFQDRSSAEIAGELDTRPANVDVIVSRARAAFGRAYAEVAELPPACRQTTETIYRELGSGATEQRLTSMHAHVAVCSRCQAEHKRAHAPRYLGALAPLLWPESGSRLATALQALLPQAAQAGGLLDRIGPASWPAPAKAALAIALVSAVVSPGAVDRIADLPVPDRDAGTTLTSLSAVAPSDAPVKIEPGAASDGAATPEVRASGACIDTGLHTGEHPLQSTDPVMHDMQRDSVRVPADLRATDDGGHAPASMTIYASHDDHIREPHLP